MTISPATAKRHRALLWLTNAPPAWPLPSAWQHPDVDYEAVLAPGQTLPAWLPPTTRTHLAPPDADRDTLRKIIAEIDADAVLPVDFILACGATKALAKACRREGVPLVALD